VILTANFSDILRLKTIFILFMFVFIIVGGFSRGNDGPRGGGGYRGGRGDDGKIIHCSYNYIFFFFSFRIELV